MPISQSSAGALPPTADLDALRAEFGAVRVLVVHDWIVAWGGAERALEELLAMFPRADLLVGLLGPGRASFNDVTRRARESWLARVPFARTHHRWFLPLYPAVFATVDARGYDLVISSAHAFAKMVRTPAAVPHLCYCYSPPRYVWDLQETYQRDSGVAGRILGLAAPLLRWVDRRSAARVDRFVAISHFIRERIMRAYGRYAAVVYPPVGRKPAGRRGGPRSGALLSLSRLVPYKRVDLAIEAANRLGRTLLVAGDGPERGRLEAMAGPSVTFLGDVSEERAGELMETSQLMLFCAEEDFGIAPVEANAHGLPVVALGRGGSLETMQDGVSATFFSDPTVDSLVAAIERASSTEWKDDAVRANAERFTAERFRRELAEQVRQLLKSDAAARR